MTSPIDDLFVALRCPICGSERSPNRSICDNCAQHVKGGQVLSTSRKTASGDGDDWMGGCLIAIFIAIIVIMVISAELG